MKKTTKELIIFLVILILVIVGSIIFYNFGIDTLFIFIGCIVAALVFIIETISPSEPNHSGDYWMYRGDDYSGKESKLAYHFIKHNTSGPKMEKELIEKYKQNSLSINEILNYIPDYREESFKIQLFDIFKSLIYSLNNKNEKIREYTTDEFYNFLISSDINGFNKIDYSKVLLNNVLKEDNLLYIHTNVIFVIDDSKLCNYDVIFVKSINVNSKSCPNCGSLLNDKATNKCPNCGAVIISNDNNIVISNMKEES